MACTSMACACHLFLKISLPVSTQKLHISLICYGVSKLKAPGPHQTSSIWLICSKTYFLFQEKTAWYYVPILISFSEFLKDTCISFEKCFRFLCYSLCYSFVIVFVHYLFCASVHYFESCLKKYFKNLYCSKQLSFWKEI